MLVSNTLILPVVLALVQMSAPGTEGAGASSFAPRVQLVFDVSNEPLSECPPGTIFRKMNGDRGWCVETTPDMYGGGQAKDTEILVPEESQGPSPFGDQNEDETGYGSPWDYY